MCAVCQPVLVWGAGCVRARVCPHAHLVRLYRLSARYTVHERVYMHPCRATYSRTPAHTGPTHQRHTRVVTHARTRAAHTRSRSLHQGWRPVHLSMAAHATTRAELTPKHIHTHLMVQTRVVGAVKGAKIVELRNWCGTPEVRGAAKPAKTPQSRAILRSQCVM